MTLTEIHEVWIELEKRLRGKLYFGENLKANVLANIITAKIEYEFIGYKIEIHQGIFERGKNSFSYKPLEIKSEIETNSNFELNTWRIDFFDRIFKQNRIKTGYREFDKKIGVKGSNQITLCEFLNNEKIRNLLIIDQMINLQIENEKGKLIIKLNAFKSSDKIESQIRFFELIIKQLENIRIISAPAYK